MCCSDQPKCASINTHAHTEQECKRGSLSVGAGVCVNIWYIQTRIRSYRLTMADPNTHTVLTPKRLFTTSLYFIHVYECISKHSHCCDLMHSASVQAHIAFVLSCKPVFKPVCEMRLCIESIHQWSSDTVKTHTHTHTYT
jgi:hypothetical protein